MSDDKEIIRRTLDMQNRATDVRFVDIPGYLEWSKRKLAEGGNEGIIAHLDAMSMWLLPEEVGKVSESVFEESFDDIREECD